MKYWSRKKCEIAGKLATFRGLISICFFKNGNIHFTVFTVISPTSAWGRFLNQYLFLELSIRTVGEENKIRASPSYQQIKRHKTCILAAFAQYWFCRLDANNTKPLYFPDRRLTQGTKGVGEKRFIVPWGNSYWLHLSFIWTKFIFMWLFKFPADRDVWEMDPRCGCVNLWGDSFTYVGSLI